MTFGLSATNDNGVTIIDGTLNNFKLLQSGTISMFGAGSGIIFYPPQDFQPLLFAAVPVGNVFTRMMNGGNFSFTLEYMFLSGPATLDYFLLVPTEGRSADTYGLEVRNPNGSTILDSGFEVVGVDGAVTYNTFSVAGLPHDFNITVSPPPVGKKRYVLMNGTGDFFRSVPDGNGISTYISTYVTRPSETLVTYRKTFSDEDAANGGGDGTWAKFTQLGMTGYK